MSDEQSRSFAEYDSMPTEELEAILRLDAEAPEEQESDEELIFYIMGVLADRKRNEITGDVAQRALDSFKEHYMPVVEKPEPAQDQPRRGRLVWLHRLSAAAAAIAIVVGLSVSANALSLRELWDIFAKWTQETFCFVMGVDTPVSEPSSDNDMDHTSLQELLKMYDIPAEIVPTWVPEGFEIEKVESDVSPVQEVFRAFYINNDRELSIYVRTYLQGDPPKTEINDDLVELYEVSGIQYYIFSNYEQSRVVWLNGSYQCNISGDISIEELKMMVDSIGKG